MAETTSPAVKEAAAIVFDHYDPLLAAAELTDPEAAEVIDSMIDSTTILAPEVFYDHLRRVATPEERIALASLRQRAGV